MQPVANNVRVEVLTRFDKDPREKVSVLLNKQPKMAVVKVVATTKETEYLAEKTLICKIGHLVAKDECFFLNEADIECEYYGEGIPT